MINQNLNQHGLRGFGPGGPSLPPAQSDAESVTRVFRLGSLLLILTALIGLSSPQALGQPAERVGSDTCLACHDLDRAFFKSLHAKTDCEDCHGPGSLHVEAGGDDPSVIFGKQSNEWGIGQCLGCHSTNNSALSAFHQSVHGKGQISCSGCHQVHSTATVNFRLLRMSQNQLCGSCHPAARAGFLKPYHHPIPEGTMKCSDCHQPHLEDGSTRNRVAIGTESGCVKCHADKNGPFVFEHGPLQIDGCETCHEPHGAINPKMLRRTNVMQVCLECHSMTPRVAAAQPPSFHDIRSPRYQNCTICHRQIHGSNSSPVFLR